jgi:hypothetical protein
MRQLPRNVRARPTANAPTGDGLPSVSRWDDEPSHTPPPVSVLAREGRLPGRGKTDADAGKTAGASRHGVVVWIGMLAGVMLACVLVLARLGVHEEVATVQTWFHAPKILEARFTAASLPLVADALREERADAHVKHDGYAPIPGGVLYTPESFSSSDGSYDLLLHFHGNVKVVVESAVAAHLNAVVAVVNLGVGSARYQDFYAAPGMYETLLEQINEAVMSRGVERAHLRRVALSSWSAGYGAISTILLTRKGVDPLDAILVLDGIHVSRTGTGQQPKLDALQMAPFEEAAHAAAASGLLFTITYSEIDPITYAGTRETALYLLDAVKDDGDVIRTMSPAPARLKLEAMRNAVSASDARYLEPIDEARVGQFHVRGFRGNTKGHHMAHLFQMGSTVLPELVSRWSNQSVRGSKLDPIRLGRRVWRNRAGQ